MKLLLLLAAAFVPLSTAGTIAISSDGSTAYFQESPKPRGSVRTLGQTFTVPSPTGENVLSSFAFHFASGTDKTFDYRAMIFEWDTVNARATGTALFSSAILNGSQAPNFTGVDLILNPSLTYVALLTTQGVNNDDFANGLLELNSVNVYAGGGAHSQTSTAANGTSGDGDWTASAWSEVNGSTDFRFDATFVGTPEPATWALLGVGLTALGLLRRPQ